MILCVSLVEQWAKFKSSSPNYHHGFDRSIIIGKNSVDIMFSIKLSLPNGVFPDDNQMLLEHYFLFGIIHLLQRAVPSFTASNSRLDSWNYIRI
jgi:hypothetical protein